MRVLTVLSVTPTFLAISTKGDLAASRSTVRMDLSRESTDAIADKLEISPGSAVLFVERRGKDADGKVVEYTQSYYRGDRYDYVVELG